MAAAGGGHSEKMVFASEAAVQERLHVGNENSSLAPASLPLYGGSRRPASPERTAPSEVPRESRAYEGWPWRTSSGSMAVMRNIFTSALA